MPTITGLPVMTAADAASIGFASFNDVPHQALEVPDGGFTYTVKTSDGRRVTFYFGPYRDGGPPEFVDIQYHDHGTAIPDAIGSTAPTFDAFAITRGGRQVVDSRALAESIKPSILVLLLDQIEAIGARPPARARH